MGFSIGRVLGRAFVAFMKNIVPFSIIALVVYSPIIVWAAVITSGEIDLGSFQTFVWVERFGTFICGAIVSGSVTFGVFQELRGAPAPIGQTMARGLSRVLSVLGVALLNGIVIILCAIPGAFVGGALAITGTAGIIIGAILMLIPIFWIATVLWVSVPVVVVERLGGTNAMNRSATLTKGHRFGLFAIALLLAAIGYAITWVGRRLLMEGVLSIQTVLVGSEVVGAILGAFGAVTSSVAYHDLRVEKDGVATEDLAKVFD